MIRFQISALLMATGFVAIGPTNLLASQIVKPAPVVLPSASTPPVTSASVPRTPTERAVDPDPKSLAVPAEQDKNARELVRQLGNRDYAEREAATRELRNMGRLALPAIREILKTDSNAEIRSRCEILLPHAVADDAEARLACFLADKDNRYKHDLPGGKEFFAAAGTTESARNLFRDIFISTQNRALLLAVNAKQEELISLVQERRAQLSARNGSTPAQSAITPIDVAALMFAESHVSERALGRAVGTGSVLTMLHQPSIRAALEAKETREPLLALLGRWIETREETSSIYSAMNMSNNLKLPHALTCAKKLLNPKLGGPAIYRAMAIAQIARSGNAKDHLPLLEAILTDETTAVMGGAPPRRATIQMRDVALAMCLIMTKQDPIAYGMKSRYSNTAGVSDTLRTSYSNFYFDDSEQKADETRNEAIKKWQEWKKKETTKTDKK